MGDRTVVIRDLQVNAEGDVFLLYTAGAVPGDGWRDWSVELTDESGRRYQPGEAFQPFWRDGSRRGGKGYVFDGQKLEGNWWVPVVPQSSVEATSLHPHVPRLSRSPITVRMEAESG